MLPSTAVHWQSSAGVGDKCEVEQLHGHDLVPKRGNLNEMFLRPCRLGLENIRAPAGLEVKLGQTLDKYDYSMAITWSLR